MKNTYIIGAPYIPGVEGYPSENDYGLEYNVIGVLGMSGKPVVLSTVRRHELGAQHVDKAIKTVCYGPITTPYVTLFIRDRIFKHPVEITWADFNEDETDIVHLPPSTTGHSYVKLAFERCAFYEDVTVGARPTGVPEGSVPTFTECFFNSAHP